VISRKVLLAADGTHDDYYYFESGSACGVLQFQGWRFAVAVGEDVWNDRGLWRGRRDYDSDPLEEFMIGGADAVINLTGIPFSRDGLQRHQKVLAWAAGKYHVPVVAVNQIGGMDSSIYPGGSMVFNNGGDLCARAALFAEDVLVVDLNNLQPCGTSGPASDGNREPEADIWSALVLGVRDFAHKCGFRQAVLGLSGGMDSALVAAIAAEALGSGNVLGIMLPSPYSSAGSIDDSLALAANLGLETLSIPIRPGLEAIDSMLAGSFAGKEAGVTEENIQARLRALILMAFSNKFGLMLLNTGNKSEAAMGYCTLYGDSAGALGVISDLYKTEVYALADWLNRKHGREVIPRAIIEKAPSAELRPEQKDSDSLPEYPLLDAILRACLDEGCDETELIERGFDVALARKVLCLFRKAEFKRRQSPPGLYVSGCALGQGDRRPIATAFK
jgi:NAD+ synthetase